ncbi:hypothetical protein [Paraburkholderia tropica]|uniref:glycoside hydrolase family 130 protein n=1 Tax=Paraburkholderia tropica TaxID=92647 RepID=UPI003D2CC4F7
MARGIIASFFGMFVMACSGCGGGGGSPAPITQSQSAAPQPSIQIVSVEANPVMGRGATGSWEWSDVLNPSVIQFNGSLSDYYSGYDGSVWRTGLATSSDGGLTWTKHGNPVLDLGGWDTRYIAANGSAINFNGKVYYYYHGIDSKGVTKIGLATSTDGVNFTAMPNPVLDVDVAGSWDDTAVADPYVVQFGNTLYMYFLGMNSAEIQLMGVATSTDGVTWTKVAGPILPQGGPNDFDAHGQGEPAVVYQAPFYYMLYVGRSTTEFRDIGWAVSSDGIHWTKQSQGMIPANLRQAWDSEVICDPTILPTGNNDGTFYVWFGGGDKAQPAQGLDGQIGRMTIKLN